jgi:hypothetical protein
MSFLGYVFSNLRALFESIHNETLQIYYLTHRKKQHKEIIKSSRGMPDVVHLRFALFESHAHALLSRNGKFLSRELFKRVDMRMKFPLCKTWSW